MREHPIVVMESDARRRRSVLGTRGEASLRDQECVRELKSELERALVVDAAEVPADVITMQTQVQALDLTSGERREYVLVFPSGADVAAHGICGTRAAWYRVAAMGFGRRDVCEFAAAPKAIFRRRCAPAKGGSERAPQGFRRQRCEFCVLQICCRRAKRRSSELA